MNGTLALLHCAALRVAVAVLVAALFPSASAGANTIEFDIGEGTPITQVRIGEETFRFALDPLVGAFVAINPEAVPRVEVRGAREDGIEAWVDEARIKGVLARASLEAGRRSHVVEVALMSRAHLPDAAGPPYDIAGGFGALPADRVIVHLGRAVDGPTRDFVFARLPTDSGPGYPLEIAGRSMRLNIQFANPSTWLDRRAAFAFMDAAWVEPVDETRMLPVWFGLSMPVQRLRTKGRLVLNGLPLGPVEARTREPLILEEPDENVIIVTGEREDQPDPIILIGTGTLDHCSRITWERKSRRLTLTCRAEG